MDSTELIAAIRHAAHLATSHPTYTDARLLLEATDTVRTVFGEPILSARQGYWLHREEQAMTTTIGNAYRIPHRSMVNGLKHVEAADSDDKFYSLRPAKESELGRITEAGEPALYDIEADYIRIYPPLANDNFTLRLSYYLRHPQLVAVQTDGEITAISGQVLSVNVIPDDQVASTSIVNGDLVDVIKGNGSHDIPVVGASITISSLDITIAAAVDVGRVAVGDFVRFAQQSDWPMLPQDFHRTLADATAVVILTDMGAVGKAAALAQKVSNDIDRLKTMIQPRNKHADRVIRPQHRAFRNRTGRRWPLAPSS